MRTYWVVGKVMMHFCNKKLRKIHHDFSNNPIFLDFLFCSADPFVYFHIGTLWIYSRIKVCSDIKQDNFPSMFFFFTVLLAFRVSLFFPINFMIILPIARAENKMKPCWDSNWDCIQFIPIWEDIIILSHLIQGHVMPFHLLRLCFIFIRMLTFFPLIYILYYCWCCCFCELIPVFKWSFQSTILEVTSRYHQCSSHSFSSCPPTPTPSNITGN